MSKTIEEIKEEVAREFFNPKRSWLENSKFSNDNDVCVLEDSGAIDEVAKRYAQQYIDANKELSAWKESMMKVHSELDLQKIGNALDMLVGTPITPNILPRILELKQSNKELVEMLEYFVYANMLSVEGDELAKELIAKHKQDEQ